MDPQTLQLWAAGSGYDSAFSAQTGAVVLLNGKGNLQTSIGLRLGQFGSSCSVGGFNYCASGSSSTVRALALDAAHRRLWAAGTQYDANGANPVLFVAAVDLNSSSVSSFLVETSTGTEARGAGVSADGSAWVVGVNSGAAFLWNADLAAGLQEWESFSAGGEANAVAEDASGAVWAAGRSGDTGEFALWDDDEAGGTIYEYDWTNSFGGSGSVGRALALGPAGAVTAAGQASTGSRNAAVLWNLSGGSFSAAVSGGSFDENAEGLALDDGGNAWVTGASGVDAFSRQFALWELPQSATSFALAATYFDPSYSPTPYADDGAAAVYAQGSVWSAGTLDGSTFASWRYILNTGNVSGSLQYAGGFTGHNVGFFLSPTPTFNGSPIELSAPAPTDTSTSFSYVLTSLPAPATYYLAAAYDVTDLLATSDGVPPGDPIGVYQNASNGAVTAVTAFFVPAGGAAASINFTAAIDLSSPTVTLAAPVSGSTITAAMFALSGTASDNTSIVDLSLAVLDATAGLWWDGSSFSSSSGPQFAVKAGYTGPVNAVTWAASTKDLSSLTSALQAGHQYSVVARAKDLVGNTTTASSVFVLESSSPSGNSSVGQTLARGPNGRFWAVANDVSGGSNVNFRIERFDSAGVFVSSFPVSKMNASGTPGIAFDGSGNVWVSAGVSSGSAQGLGVWELSSNMVLIGSSTYFPSAGSSVIPGRIALSGSGNAWVAVGEQTGSAAALKLFKFNAGAVRAGGFPVTYQGGGGVDLGAAAAVDGSGNVWIVGASSNSATSALDLALWKYSGSFGSPTLWPGAFAAAAGATASLALDSSGRPVVVAQKSFASCSTGEFALLRYDTNGTMLSSSAWHDAAGLGSRGRSLALDTAGNIWSVGNSSSTSLLWKYGSSGDLLAGYPQTYTGSTGFNPRAVTLDAAGAPWVMLGDKPNIFQSGGAASGAAGPALCALTGQTQVTGVITNPAGFTDGGTLTLAVSTNPILSGRPEPAFYPFTTSAGTTYSYTLTLAAPATYYIVAVGAAVADNLPPGTPAADYNNYAPVIAAAGGSVANVNVTLAPDSTPPTSGISIANGSTLAVLSYIAGTATDNVAVGGLALAAHDLTSDLWWNANAQQWFSTGTPYFQSVQPAFSGNSGTASWRESVSASAGGDNFGGFNAYLAKGHHYQLISQANDIVNNVETPSSGITFTWSGAGSGTPNPPQNIQGAALGVSSIAWSWQSSQGASSYNVYLGTSVFLSSTTQTSFLLTGLSTDTASVLCVSGVNQFGPGTQACGQAAYTLAAQPGQPSFTSVGLSSFTFTWNPNGNPAGAQYVAQVSTNSFATVSASQSVFSTGAVFSGLGSGTMFQVRVQGLNQAGVPTDFSSQASTLTLPDAPTNLQGQALGVSSISWTWSAPTGASGYNLFTSTGAFLGTTASTVFLETALSTNAAYGFCLAAFDVSGQGPLACTSSVYTLAAQPGAPVFSFVGKDSFQMNWDPHGNPLGTQYLAQLSTNSFATVYSSQTQTLPPSFFGALPSGTNFQAEVQAINVAGVPTGFSPQSSTQTLGVPLAPSIMAAVVDQTVKVVRLSWQAPSGDTPAASYNIYRGVSSDTSTYTSLFAGATVTTYADVPSQSATYYYQVSGVSAQGIEGPRSDSAFAAIDLFPPQTVTDLRIAAIAAGQLTLAWTAPSDDSSGVKGSRVFLSADGSFAPASSSFTIAAVAPGSTATFTVSVSSVQAMYFRLRSQDNAGNVSSPSNTVLFDPVPPVLSSVSLTDGQTISRPLFINVQVTDNISVASVAFSVDGILVSSTTSSSAQFFWDTRLLQDGAHTVAISAYDNAGNTQSAAFNETVNYAPPSPPVITFPSAGFATKVATINVTGTSEGNVGIQLQANGIDLDSAAVQNGSWSILPETLPLEGPVSLTAIAFETRGFSSPSNAVNGLFASHAPQAPVLPNGTGAANGQALISWSASSQGETPTHYRVYRSTDDFDLIEGGPAPDPSFLLADVTTMTFIDNPAVDDLYFYGVTAADAAGNESPLSDVVYVVTDRVPPSAQVLISTPSPLIPGAYLVQFQLSEPLSLPPLVTFTPPGSGAQPSSLNLDGLTATLWQATVTVTSAMIPGTATFAFQGSDLVDNVGTAIGSATWTLDTVGPVGTVALSKTSPVGPGTLGIALTLDKAAGSAPALSVLPQGGTPLAIALSAAAPFNGTSWTGSFAVSSNTGEGAASLSYSAADVYGVAGSQLLGATSFAVDTIAPGAPLAVRANSLPANQVSLTWSQPFGDRPAYYWIYRDSVRISTQVTPAADGSGAYVDTAPSGLHQYQVSSLDLAGNESAQTDPTALARGTPPAPPVASTAAINGFGQIQVAWQSGSTDTARFALYRATYSAASVAGLPRLSPNAVSPFPDSPPVDGIYHYYVTALDSVGNESTPGPEAVVVWAQGAPAISIAGVVDGAYYSVSTAPVYSIVDQTLDAASVRALLDGQTFVSGSTVTAEGRHTLVVSAANIKGHSSTAQATFTIVKTPPAITFSVADGAAIRSTAPVSVQVAVASLAPGTTSYSLFNALFGSTVTYNSGDPIAANGQYRLSVTATDLAGNTATGAVSFSLESAPLSPANLTVKIGSDAQLSWTQPEADVAGYRIYRDGQHISASLSAGTYFEDTGFTTGGHVYEVSAVDAAGVEGARARATVPAATLTLPTLTLTRGFFDALQPTLLNGSSSALNAGPAVLTLVDSNGAAVASATAPVANAAAGASVALSGVIATPAALTTSSLLHVSVSLPTDAGSSVLLTGDYTLAAADPRQPLLEVYPDSLVPGANSAVRVRLYNRGSAPMDIETAQVSASTYAPVNSVSVQLQTAQGTLLASGGLMQTGDGANITFSGGQQVFFVTIPAGSSFLFDPVQIVVPNATTQSLSVVATVSTPTFNLPITAVQGTRSFTSAVVQGTVSQIPYFASASAQLGYYDQGSSVTLTGRVFDSSGTSRANSAAVIHILSGGFSRTVSAVSDSSGNFTAAFFPLPTEAGIYNVFATYPTLVTAAVQSTFTLVGFSYQYTNYTATLASNSSLKFTVDLQNSGGAALTGLSASSATITGSGVTLTLDPATLPSSLPAGGKATLGLTLSALTSATTSNLTLVVTEEHGFFRTLPISVTVVPAQVIPVVTPQQFSIGMIGGDMRTVSIVVQNKGFDVWRGVQISNPALNWATIQGPSSLGDIPPGGNANVIIQFAPPSSLANQTYSPSPLFLLTSQNVAPVPVQGAVALTSARKGDVLVSAINADKPLVNGQGVPVTGAKVTLTSLDVPGLNFVVNGDQNGLSSFSQVPSGNYAWNVTASGFQTQAGTAVIEPGMTNQIQAVMATTVVSYQWSVTPTSVLDQYSITLNLTFKTDVPAPAILVDPPVFNLAMAGGQTLVTQITITNKGLVSALDYKINLSGDPAISIAVPFTTIPEIKPGQSIVVPVNITLAHASCHGGSIGGSYSYPCAAGFPESGSAPSVGMSIGDCPGAGGSGGSGGVGGGGFVTTTGPGTLATAVGAPSMGGQCSSAPGGGGPKKGTQNQSAPPKGSQGRNVNSTRGTTVLQGCELCKAVASPSMSFETFYNTFDLTPSFYGLGWTASSSINVIVNDDGSYTLTDAAGDKFVFIPTGPLNQPLNGGGCQFSSPVGQYSTMEAVSNEGFSATDPNRPLVVQERDSAGNTTLFRLYTSTYFPVYFADKNGSYIQYDRDSDGRVLKQTDIHGRYLVYGYDSNKHLTSVADETGRVVTFTYNSAGDQVSATDVLGDVTQYAYDSNHHLTQVTYPNGGHTTFTYYTDGTTASESDDNGNNLLSYSYGASSTTITDSLGRKRTEWWAEMDGNRKISRIVDAAGGTTSFEFDAKFNTSQVTDALGRVTKYQHDSNGNVTSVTDANNQTTRIDYLLAGGSLEQATFSSGGSGGQQGSSGGSCGGGGSQGLAASEPPPNLKPVVLSQPISLPIKVTDPKGNGTSFSYDGKYNLVQVQDAQANSTQFSYDSQGHLTAVRNALGAVMSEIYNNNGAAISFTDPLGHVETMTRDPLSRITLNTDADGNQTAFSYDNGDDLLQTKDALNNTTNIAYQPGRHGRLAASVTDAKNHSANYHYDLIGRVTSVSNSLGQANSISYDTKSRPVSATTRNGQNLGFSYDSLDRLTALSTPEGSLTLSYDAVGNLLTANSYNGSVLAITHNSVHRVTQLNQTLTNGYSAAISYAYDANGNRTQMTTPWGSFNYTYDSLNRVTSVLNPAGQSVSFNYDSLGRRTTMSYPNGVKTSYGYDAAGKVTQIVHQKVADRSAVAFDNYTYDAVGNRTTIIDSHGSHGFTYDALHRLTAASHAATTTLPIRSEVFTYDAIGNRTNDAVRNSYMYDAANRIVSDSSFTYTSDANGNTTSRTSKANGQTTTFIYDSGNRLVQVNGATGMAASYKYDAAGNRIEKNVGGTVTRYVYDGKDILAILDANNNVLELFTDGPGIDSPLIMREGSQDYFFHADALANVDALTDINGNVIESYEYQAFGKVVVKDLQGDTHGRSTVGNPFLYASRELDTETGLYYMRARYYGQETGRFLQEDPISNVNQYAYAANNPISLSDPLGLCVINDFSNGLVAGMTFGLSEPNNTTDQNSIAFWAGVTLGFGGDVLTGSFLVDILGPAYFMWSAGAAGGTAAAYPESAAQYEALKNDLAYQEANSAFTETGELSKGALEDSIEIIPASKIGNSVSNGGVIPDGYGKYATQFYQSPSGPFQAHFYQNAEGAVYYGADYKVLTGNDATAFGVFK